MYAALSASLPVLKWQETVFACESSQEGTQEPYSMLKIIQTHDFSRGVKIPAGNRHQAGSYPRP
jgi:hypothetical protein